MSNINLLMTKEDGSLVSSYIGVDGRVYLKSKASLHSQQATQGTEWLRQRPDVERRVQEITNSKITINFEWVSPSNQIVVFYPVAELIVLNAISRDGQIQAPYTIPGLRSVATHTIQSIEDLQEVASNQPYSNFEGWVARFDSGLFAKLKVHEYVTRHKAKDDIFSDKKLLEMCLGDEVDDMIALFDDQLIRTRIEKFRAYASALVANLTEQINAFYNANKELSRKDYAIKGQSEAKNVFSLVMNLYLGKPAELKDYIMRHFDEFAPTNLSSPVTF